jgi:hypothetical protein
MPQALRRWTTLSGVVAAAVALAVGAAGAAPIIVSTTQTEVTIGGLTCGTQYRVRVNVTGSPKVTTLKAVTEPCPLPQPPPPPEPSPPPPPPAPPPPPPPPPSPPPSAYPDASNTGPTGPLVESTGSFTVTVPGTVIQNRKINGCILIEANNVTIRNSEINCDGIAGVWNRGTTYSGLLVEDSEIECGHKPEQTGISNTNYTIRRSELFGCENILWAQRNVVIEDNYIHDTIPCCIWPEPKPHTDAIQIPSGAGNIRIVHNRVYGGYINQSDFGNAAITMGGNVSGIVVDNNILAGGGYTLYCEQEQLGGNGSPQPQYTNNRFSRIFVNTVGGFGPATSCSDEIQSGNVYHETGAPLVLG